MTSTIEKNQFTLLIGSGINTDNPLPTTSINKVIGYYNQAHHTKLSALSMEEMLVSILEAFEKLYTRFLIGGMEPLLDLYYKRWLQHVRNKQNISNIIAEVYVKEYAAKYSLLLY